MRTAKKLRWKKIRKVGAEATLEPIDHDYWIYGNRSQTGEPGFRKTIWSWRIVYSPKGQRPKRLKEHLSGTASDAKAWARQCERVLV